MKKSGKSSRESSGLSQSTRMYRARSHENVFSSSLANTKLWENRLGCSEVSRHEYRQSARRFAAQNEDLSSQLVRNERDTIDVISYLKEKIKELEKALKAELENSHLQKKTFRQELEKVITDFTKQISHLDVKLQDRNHEVHVLKDELKFAKDFRRNRREMLTEISELKKTIDLSKQNHKLEFARLEKKFIQEKSQLETDTKLKLDELSEKTHKEAICNLNEATKNIFKDNIRLKEALNLETKEIEKLRKSVDLLKTENTTLKGDNQINNHILKDKLLHSKHEHEKLLTSKSKVDVLETSLNHIIREFELEQNKPGKAPTEEVLSIKEELDRLQRVIEIKTREMVKIKRLAKNILDQRTEVESFFMEALDSVKSEIVNAKSNPKKSRGCVSMSALEEAETLNNLRKTNGQVDISDLTWLQKERVLRLLFAKMNGYSRYTTVSLSPETKVRKFNTVPPSNKDGDVDEEFN